jgi:hypothetical protein
MRTIRNFKRLRLAGCRPPVFLRPLDPACQICALASRLLLQERNLEQSFGMERTAAAAA